MKKVLLLLFVIAAISSIFADDQKKNLIYASNKPMNMGEDYFHQKEFVTEGGIDLETYTNLINDLRHVGDKRSRPDNKINIDGEIRYHYAFNSGYGSWDRDSSGIRTRLYFGTEINSKWRINGMLEGNNNLVNYKNDFKLPRLSLVEKLGTSMVRAGSFSYLMAEGNIYDSGFKGIRFEFGGPVRYMASYGETSDTKETYVATARYTDFDYNLEAGIYHYQMDYGFYSHNTIWSLGGNYNFSNFGVGAMLLGSNHKDVKGNRNGYVLSFNYGDLRSYRTGTYDAFIKYYNQPRDTYISHGMNGKGSSMQGFKGYGLGSHYTLAKNIVGGIEYYNLADKISAKKGDTWWTEITYYF